MDTILALKASGVSSSTMSGGSRFQSLTVLGKKDIFLVSIRQDSIEAYGLSENTIKLLKSYLENRRQHIKIG
jgi:hypothetical protein